MRKIKEKKLKYRALIFCNIIDVSILLTRSTRSHFARGTAVRPFPVLSISHILHSICIDLGRTPIIIGRRISNAIKFRLGSKSEGKGA